MARLPKIGGDDSNWGTILNDFLSQSLTSTGTLKSNVVAASNIADGTISGSKLDEATQGSIAKANSSLQASDNLSDLNDASEALSNIGAAAADHTHTASSITINDTGDLFEATDVNTALQELGGMIDGSIGSTSIYINVKEYGVIGDGETDDTQAIIDLCGVAGNALFFPVGTYVINDEIPLAEGVSVTGSGQSSILSFDSDSSRICVNENCTINNITCSLKALFNGSCFEISSRTITQCAKNSQANISIKDVKIISPDSYEAMNDYEGTIFLIYAATGLSVDNFWSVSISNIIFSGMVKYFCRNYYSTTSWISSVSFNNIFIASVKYGWFGAIDESQIESVTYRDVQSLVLNDIHYQYNDSLHVAYFSAGNKTLSSMTIWDWPSPSVTSKFCLSESCARTENDRIIIDKVGISLEEDFRVKELDNSLSSYYIRKMVSTNAVEYIGDRSEYNEVEYTETFREFGVTFAEVPPIWYSARLFIEGSGAVARAFMKIYTGLDVKPLLLCFLKTGATWNYNYVSDKNISEDLDIYGKVTETDDGKIIDLYFRFITNPGSYAFYSTISKTEWWDEIALEKQVETPDTTGYETFVSIYRGVYLTDLPSGYVPLLDPALTPNYMAQADNQVVYKTKNEVTEHIPKIRMGVESVTSTPAAVTFSDIGSSEFRVFSNSTGVVTITDKSSTGFSIACTVDEDVEWLAVI